MSGDDRPRRSWREIDQMRDGTRGRADDVHSRPRGKAEQARLKAASQAYLKDAEKLFANSPGGAEGKRLANAMHDAHGTTGLADACREYCAALGTPKDPSLLSLLLDCDDRNLVLAGIETLQELQAAGGLEISSGTRSQLRILSQGFDDAVAEAAEELLERI